MITSTSLPEKYRARFTDGEHEALADTGQDHGGQFAGFRPHDLLSAALANCLGMTVRIAADARGIPLAGVTVRVQLNTDSAGGNVFEFDIELAGELTEEQRASLLRAAQGCPVKKLLGGPVSFRSLA